MNRNKTLVLWIDGLRRDYLNKNDTPFLYDLIEKYGCGELEQPFGYNSIGASFFSGVWPENHGQFTAYKLGKEKIKSSFLNILPRQFGAYYFNLKEYFKGNDFFSPFIPYKYAKNFSLAQKKYYHHKSALGHKTLFDFLRQNQKTFLVYQWPLVINGNKTNLSLVKNNDNSRTENFLNLCKKKYDFYFLHLWDLDKCGHIYGPDSIEIKEKVKETDNLVKQIMNGFNLDKNNILIWSDHGMLKIKKIIDLEQKLPKKPGYVYFLDSTMARFWFFNNEIKKEVVYILKTIRSGHLLSSEEKIKYKINFLHNEYGDEIFLVDSGILILPNFFQTTVLKGMHGYDLSDENEKGIIISNRFKAEKAKTVDLMPAIMKMMKIED